MFSSLPRLFYSLEQDLVRPAPGRFPATLARIATTVNTAHKRAAPAVFAPVAITSANELLFIVNALT
jgi:hypothetical protein